jgi:hypothetical protein
MTQPCALRTRSRAWPVGFLGVLQTWFRQNTPLRHLSLAFSGQSTYPHACALLPFDFSTNHPSPSSSARAASMVLSGCLGLVVGSLRPPSCQLTTACYCPVSSVANFCETVFARHLLSGVPSSQGNMGKVGQLAVSRSLGCNTYGSLIAAASSGCFLSPSGVMVLSEVVISTPHDGVRQQVVSDVRGGVSGAYVTPPTTSTRSTCLRPFGTWLPVSLAGI